jgi:hypothetical protein
MNKELKRQLLKESKYSIFAKASLIEMYVKEVEGLTICIKHTPFNPELFDQAYKNAKRYYKRELNSYTFWGKIINFIKYSL